MSKKDYTDKINQVLDILSTTHKGLAKTCKELGISVNTFYDWVNESPENEKRYVRAREAQADLLVDEMIAIADDGSNDLMTIERGDVSYEIENKEVTNRSKLRVDTRKWLAAKLRPKKYGDKLDVEAKVDATLTTITGMEIK